MIDHDNTCKNIYVQYLTLTFISRSNLGQIPLKVTRQSHSDLRTLYVLDFYRIYNCLCGLKSIMINARLSGVYTGHIKPSIDIKHRFPGLLLLIAEIVVPMH
jgi:hypothetical protein